MLQPEVTEGPYNVKGELTRSDIRESQVASTSTSSSNHRRQHVHGGREPVRQLLALQHYGHVRQCGCTSGNSADATIYKTFNRGLVNFMTTSRPRHGSCNPHPLGHAMQQAKAISVYATNKQTATANAQDSIFLQLTTSGFDPILHYVLLRLGQNSVSRGSRNRKCIGTNRLPSKHFAEVL